MIHKNKIIESLYMITLYKHIQQYNTTDGLPEIHQILYMLSQVYCHIKHMRGQMKALIIILYVNVELHLRKPDMVYKSHQ